MGAAGAAGAAETVVCMVHPNAVPQRNAGDYDIYSEIRLTRWHSCCRLLHACGAFSLRLRLSSC